VDTAAQMFASGNHQAIGVGILLLFALPVPVFTFTFYTIHQLVAKAHPASKRLYYEVDENVLIKRSGEKWYQKIFVKPVAGATTLGTSLLFALTLSALLLSFFLFYYFFYLHIFNTLWESRLFRR
jgi:hypothetical protein